MTDAPDLSGVVTTMRAAGTEIDRLREINKELLAALEDIRDNSFSGYAYDVAERAINEAKAK